MAIIIQKSIINQVHQHLFNIYSIAGIMLFMIGEHQRTRVPVVYTLI